MKASDLSVGDIGKTFRSITYPNNNKTAKPYAHYNSNFHVIIQSERNGNDY